MQRLYPRCPGGCKGITTRQERASSSEAEAAYAAFIPAQMVGQLVAHGSLDLRPQPVGIVAEVPWPDRQPVPRVLELARLAILRFPDGLPYAIEL
jgi:hypothetical protein